MVEGFMEILIPRLYQDKTTVKILSGSLLLPQREYETLLPPARLS